MYPPLPAYESRTSENRTQHPAPNPADIDTRTFYGGGGVRIPLSAAEKEREDLRSLSHLASFGVQVWVRGFDE